MTEQEYNDRIKEMIRQSSKDCDRKIYIPKPTLKELRIKKLKQIENGIKN